MNHDHTCYQSLFPGLIHTNHVPDIEHRNEIFQFLNRPQQRVFDLNIQIAQLEARLEVLKNERDSLQVIIDDHLALLSPFRRLSEDIVREIFMHCRDTCPVRSTKDAPLLLTRVCQSWHRIALGTPRLWSAIHIRVPSVREFERSRATKKEQNLDQRARGIQRWLDRSGTLPISFSLMVASAYHPSHDLIDPNINEDYLAAVHAIIAVFLGYRHRWRAVRLRGALANILKPLLEVKPGELPKLQALRASSHNDTAVAETSLDSNLHHILRHAPALHQFSLNMADLRQINTTTVLVRWDQMSELQLTTSQHGSSPYDILTILTAASRTIHKFCCVMELETPATDYSRLFDRVVDLPKLTKLSLTFRKASNPGVGWQGWGVVNPVNDNDWNLSNDDIDSVLRMISCPSLEDLTFEVFSELRTDHIHIPSLEHFIRQSGCSLKAFATNLPLSTAGFQNLVRAMPSITILKHLTTRRRIHSSPAPNVGSMSPDAFHPLLQALISSTDIETMLCPALKHFQLTHINPEDAEPIVRWTRTRIGSGLRTLTFVFNGHTPEEYRRDVEGFREEGLTVTWVHRRPVLAEDPPEGGLQVVQGDMDSADDWKTPIWTVGVALETRGLAQY